MVDYCIVCGHGGNDVRMATEAEFPGTISVPLCDSCRAKPIEELRSLVKGTCWACEGDNPDEPHTC